MGSKSAQLYPRNFRGRPPKFEDPSELQALIWEYFNGGCQTKTVISGGAEFQVPVPTISGLAIFCGFSDRHSFYEYEKKPDFTHTVKLARAMIETHYEQLIQGANPAGAIFALKNFGWSDKTEVEQTMRVTVMPTVRLANGDPLMLDVGDPVPDKASTTTLYCDEMDDALPPEPPQP